MTVIEEGMLVRIKAVKPEDKCVAVALASKIGKIGTVTAKSIIDSSFFVEFEDGSGGVFYPTEVEIMNRERRRQNNEPRT